MVRDSETSVVRGQAASSVRRSSSRGAETTEKMSSSSRQPAKYPIVRPAIRLPKDLYEKMPSAPTTPVSARKEQPVTSKLATESNSGYQSTVKSRNPKTVASMVRR